MSSGSGSARYDLLDQLAEEFADRFRRGERPSLEEYADRYPELADEIRDLFPAMVKIERADGLREDEPATADSSAAHPPLSRVGDYRILREIGRGGMGVVYEAEQISLGRRVALKVLPSRVSTEPIVLERFRREARAAAQLHHTNIVPVFEVGQDGDVRFYAMQFIQGQGLDLVITELRRLRRRARPESAGRAVPEGRSSPPRDVQSGPGGAGPTIGAVVELGPVLRSILTGRFDPGAHAQDRPEPHRSTLATAFTGGIATPTRNLSANDTAGSDAALAHTEAESATVGNSHGSQRGHSPAPVLASSDLMPSSSAILPGGTQLSSVDSRRGAFFRSLAHIGRQVAGGLAYAHARGIVHRDIKPSNLLLDTDGVVWITDFGLVKGDDDGLTRSGDIVGTIGYMAPERFRGAGDARADIYALGLTLYELLTLRSGFDSTDRLRLIEQIKNDEPRKPRSVDPRIPRDLETIVLKAIEKDPRARYQSAAAMGEDLRRFLADEPIQARQVTAAERYWRWARRNPVIAALGGLLTALLIVTTVGSLVAAAYFRDSATREQSAKRQAIEQRDHSRQQSADLALDKGLALAEAGHADQGLIWMLQALKTAPDHAAGFRSMVRWNLGAWLGQVHKPLGIFDTDGLCTDLAFSPDGRSYATGWFSGEHSIVTPVTIWDTVSGRKRSSLAGVFAPFAFRPDGEVLVAVADKRRTVAVDLVTGRSLWTTARLSGDFGNRRPARIGFSRDGSTVHSFLTGSGAAGFLPLDAATGGQRTEPLRGWHRTAVAPDGKTLATGRFENGELNVDVLDLPSGRCTASWRASLPNLVNLLFSPDGSSLYCSYSPGRDQDDPFNNGRYVAEIRDPHTARQISPLMTSAAHGIYTPAADRLVTWTDSLWRVRDAFDGRIRGTGFPADIVDFGVLHESIAMHPDGRTVLVPAIDSTVRLSQILADAEPVADTEADKSASMTRSILDRPARMGFSAGLWADGRVAVSVVNTITGRDRIRLADPATGRPSGVLAPHDTAWAVRVVALSPDGQLVATGSYSRRWEGEVRVFVASTGRLRLPPIPHTNDVSALAFHPDGKVLAAGDYDGLVRTWDLATGREIGLPLAQGEIVLSLAYSPDGNSLAVGLANDVSGKAGVRLWDTRTRRPISDLLPSTHYVSHIEFRPDGRALLAGNLQAFATWLWDTRRGRAIGDPIVHEAAGAFRPDGQAFLTLGKDGTVRLRDAATGEVLKVLLTSSSPATCAAFRGDGGLVVAGFEDGTVRLCDPASAHPVGPPRSMRQTVHQVAFTPDGRSVAAINQSGESRTWPVPAPLADSSVGDLTLRIEARTGLRMETGLAISRLDAPAWRQRLDELSRLDPSAVQPDNGPAWHEPMIREAEQNANPFAALWHLDRLIAARPDAWFLHARRARAWLLSDKFDKAAADYQQAERLGSREQVLDFQGHCAIDCTAAERWLAALWYLDRLIAARPDDRLLHEDRAAVFAKLGRSADRQTELARVFELGADAGLVIPRAEELGRGGRWAEAAALLARCGRAGPLSRELARAWGVAALNAGDRAAYREVCAAAMARQGRAPTVVLDAFAAASLLALGAEGLDDYQVAMSWFDKPQSTADAPGPINWHYFPNANAVAGLLVRAGRLDEAITSLNEGIQAASKAKTDESPCDWAYLALAHARRRSFPQARRWLERLGTWRTDPRASFWDLQELGLLRSEAESLIADAQFPTAPFAGTSRQGNPRIESGTICVP
jgi:serine/threonine protein kinase/WD40 repeat protein/tetratricopeptide (TPR) repeat protein